MFKNSSYILYISDWVPCLLKMTWFSDLYHVHFKSCCIFPLLTDTFSLWELCVLCESVLGHSTTVQIFRWGFSHISCFSSLIFWESQLWVYYSMLSFWYYNKKGILKRSLWYGFLECNIVDIKISMVNNSWELVTFVPGPVISTLFTLTH